jgi:hypothetical protein
MIAIVENRNLALSDGLVRFVERYLHGIATPALTYCDGDRRHAMADLHARPETARGKRGGRRCVAPYPQEVIRSHGRGQQRWVAASSTPKERGHDRRQWRRNASEKFRESNAMDDDQLWERDVYRIFFVVLSGDEQPLGLSSEFCALADCVSPQAVMPAQWDVRADLEDGSRPRHHVVPCNVPKIFFRFGLPNRPDCEIFERDIPRKSLKRRRSPTKHRPMLSSREALCRPAARAISRTWDLGMSASGKSALSRLDSWIDER